MISNKNIFLFICLLHLISSISAQQFELKTVNYDNNLTGKGNKNEIFVSTSFVVEQSFQNITANAVISLDGTTSLSDIKSIKIYSKNHDATFDIRDPKAVLVGQLSKINKKNSIVPICFSADLGTLNLWVVAETSQKAKEGNLICLKFEKIDFNTHTLEIEKQDTCAKRELILTRKLLFAPGDDNSTNYRIPAIITAADGSLVTATDKRKFNSADLPQDIDVVIKRSTDNGKSWSKALCIAEGKGKGKGFGDAALVRCANNDILAIFIGGTGVFESTPENIQRTYLCRSTDNGFSWGKPQDITEQLYGNDCEDAVRKGWYASFCASGAALCTKNGRLMVVAAVRENHERILSNYVYYSDDNGATWNVSMRAKLGGDEAKLVELPNNRFLMSIRNIKGGARYYNLSEDGGMTWNEDNTLCWNELLEPGCNGEIIRYNDKYLLHTIPFGNKRRNVSLFTSMDEGKSWQFAKSLCKTGSAYSSITILPDKTIGVYLEESNGTPNYYLYFLNFSFHWLTNKKQQ